MKSASSAVRAIIATGACLRADLWSFAIPGGGTYNFTTHQEPLTVSGITYQTGLALTRGAFTQTNTLEVQTLDLTVVPQSDSPNAPILIGGVPFLQAVKNRAFNKAVVTWSKLFLASWDDTSPGAVEWTVLGVNNWVVGRETADLTLNSQIEALNVQMPRNIVQASCLYRVFGAGCALDPGAFQVFGTVTGTPTTTSWNTNLTQVDDYFSRGVLTWATGVNAGLTRTIKQFVHASGAMQPIQPMPATPHAGDTFTILPACKKTLAACSNTSTALGPALNNRSHFRGEPFVPNPETLYDGGTTGSSVPSLGGQGGAGVGSQFSSKTPLFNV